MVNLKTSAGAVGYNRPNEDWICGHLASGNPCPLGPDASGECRASYACVPEDNGQRFQCSRSELLGGPCQKGPHPDGCCGLKLQKCAPQPSLRKRRKSVTLWLSGLVIGLLAVILVGGKANELLMPGPLATSHASLTDCQSCHAGEFSGNLSWLHNLTQAAAPHDSTKLCLNCHDIGADALRPHTHPVEQLRALTEKANGRASSTANGSLFRPVVFRAPPSVTEPGGGTVYCSSCHSDHQGTEADLTEMSDGQCQTCHADTFASFGSGHPEFTSYPFDRRTRLKFNHQSHFSRHFPESRKNPALQSSLPKDCAGCHLPGEGQRYMEIQSFDGMCSGCHLQDIQGETRASGPKGIDFLLVPGMDVQTFDERQIDIGSWPEDAEGIPTPFMQWMLSLQANGHDLVAETGHLDLLDLRDASEEELQQVAELAWAIKELFQDLEASGLKNVLHLPANSDGAPVDDFQFSSMTAVMPRDVIVSANREWFDDLQEDLQRRLAGRPTRHFEDLEAPPSSTSQGDAETQGELVGGEGELQEEDTGSLDLQEDQVDLLDDDNGLEEAGLLEETGLLEEAGLLEDEGLEAEPADGLILENAREEEGGDLDLLAEPAGELDDQDALLGEDDGELGLGERQNDLLEEETPSDELLIANEDEGTATTNAGQEGDEYAEQETPAKTSAEDWASLGGWYRDEFSIRYRPGGHSDRFLRSWITYSGHARGGEHDRLASRIFDLLTPPDAQGRCMKCHSVDDEAGMKHPKWRAFSTRRVKDRFTVFNHQPHIRASGSEGCGLCHQAFQTVKDFDVTYAQGDASVFVPQFAPMEKDLCEGCHTPIAADDSCTTCHNYHATEFGRPMVRTALPFNDARVADPN